MADIAFHGCWRWEALDQWNLHTDPSHAESVQGPDTEANAFSEVGTAVKFSELVEEGEHDNGQDEVDWHLVATVAQSQPSQELDSVLSQDEEDSPSYQDDSATVPHLCMDPQLFFFLFFCRRAPLI